MEYSAFPGVSLRPFEQPARARRVVQGITMRVLRVLLALGLCLPVVSPAKGAAPVPELHALFDSAWQRDLEDDPLAATQYGDRRYNDRLPDLSPA
jgi:hypothetical protein